jgi:membrane associated rhomboid family serine protease
VLPFIDTAPRARRPYVVIGLIAINGLVFLWMESLPPRSLNAVIVHLALIPLRYTDPQAALGAGLDPDNWWPLLTNTFMHGGWLHLILNMWFLWIFGPAMEARLGRFWFAAMYLGGAVAASFVHLITHLDSAEPALGASGAIAAVIAAYAVTYPTARVITIIPIFIVVPLFIPIPAILFAGFWFILQVIQGSSELVSPGMAGGVAWWAHIGGFAFGAVFALVAAMAGIGMQTSTMVWSGRGARGSVPSIRARDWQR